MNKPNSIQLREDNSLFTRLYQQHAPALLTHLIIHLPSRMDAEDILVDVFVVALEQQVLLATLSHEERGLWLWRVARNKLIDYYRRASRRQTVALDEVAETIFNDDTFDNQFGLVFHYNSPKKGHTTFYFFGVANAKDNGEYIFAKYDNGFGDDTPWSILWHQKLGKEYHLGHGAKFNNTLKVAVNSKNFTLYMNGKKLASVQDTASFSNGQIGMLVNLKGTEIAFSHLLLTKD